VTTRPRIRTSELTVPGAGRVPATGLPVMHSARGEGPMWRWWRFAVRIRPNAPSGEVIGGSQRDAAVADQLGVFRHCHAGSVAQLIS